MHAGGTALVVLFIIIGVIWAACIKARQQHLVEKGLGKYMVKVAASGKGKTYHAPHCNRCRGAIVMTLEQAQKNGYNRCSFCGGRPGFVRTG